MAMGQLEARSRSRRRKKNIQVALVAALCVSGFIVWSAMAPNTLQLLKHLEKSDRFLKYRIKSAAGRLVAKGQACWVSRDGKTYLEITEKGKAEFALERSKAGLLASKPRRWDGRWRIVAFDVPERMRRTRDVLRAVMRDVGFVRMQDSVWVYPYDCEDFIALLKARLRTGRSILYVIADQVEADKTLREHFGLAKS